MVIALTCGIALLLAGAMGATPMIQHLLQKAHKPQRLRLPEPNSQATTPQTTAATPQNPPA